MKSSHLHTYSQVFHEEGIPTPDVVMFSQHEITKIGQLHFVTWHVQYPITRWSKRTTFKSMEVSSEQALFLCGRANY